MCLQNTDKVETKSCTDYILAIWENIRYGQQKYYNMIICLLPSARKSLTCLSYQMCLSIFCFFYLPRYFFLLILVLECWFLDESICEVVKDSLLAKALMLNTVCY